MAPEGYAPGIASLGGGTGGGVTPDGRLIVGVTGEIAPGDEVVVVVLLLEGRQEVVTEQLAQSKLIAYPLEPAASPWKVPEESIVTPEKETHPALWSQAQPPSVPPLFVTPPAVGERLIHPSFSLQA